MIRDVLTVVGYTVVLLALLVACLFVPLALVGQ